MALGANWLVVITLRMTLRTARNQYAGDFLCVCQSGAFTQGEIMPVSLLLVKKYKNQDLMKDKQTLQSTDCSIL